MTDDEIQTLYAAWVAAWEVDPIAHAHATTAGHLADALPPELRDLLTMAGALVLLAKAHPDEAPQMYPAIDLAVQMVMVTSGYADLAAAEWARSWDDR